VLNGFAVVVTTSTGPPGPWVGGGGGGADVVNVQVKSAAMALPAVSLTAALTTPVYIVE
jgi:hypothetical protein